MSQVVVNDARLSLYLETSKHSIRMRTDCAVIWMSSEPVAVRLIVDRMTDACENITFPCSR